MNVTCEVALVAFVDDLRARLGGALDVEVHQFDKGEGKSFTGYMLTPSHQNAASLEVWAGPGGWHITVAGVCDMELPESDSSYALGTLRSVIAYGVEVRRRGLGRILRAGPPPPADEKLTRLVHRWDPWVPGFSWSDAERTDEFRCRISFWPGTKVVWSS